MKCHKGTAKVYECLMISFRKGVAICGTVKILLQEILFGTRSCVATRLLMLGHDEILCVLLYFQDLTIRKESPLQEILTALLQSHVPFKSPWDLSFIHCLTS